ncbi:MULTISPECIES: hypothetical protein [unclassified Ensifer]|uniref:hypothetical protein n=1 Tax=unclassified Ensifer TaxID=2633371 RepID=UPI0007145DE2|nr:MULTISPECIES: hypothetical protein [unclassified Ensifer]KRD01678.1 hypothetical protein ASE47_22175 [Ensifer sp. Root258]
MTATRCVAGQCSIERCGRWPVVARFGLPAAVAAIVEASLLTRSDKMPALASYTLGDRPMKSLSSRPSSGADRRIRILELWPRLHTLAFPSHRLPLGGVLSGVFGGLSDNQEALRSAFC